MKFLTKIIFSFFFISLFFNCKKDHKVLGVDVQPDKDALNAEFNDSTPVYAFTKKYDSIVSLNTRFKYIGSNLDPYFGNTNIGLYTNANFSVEPLNFGSGSFITSANIVLAIDNVNFAGDANAILNYSVFPLDSALLGTRSYYASNNRLHNKNAIGTGSVAFSTMNGQLVLNLPIDTTFAGMVMRDVPNLASNSIFQAKYRGFYITMARQSGSEGIIYQVDMEHDVSGLYFNYKRNAVDSAFKFIFYGPKAAKYNTLNYDPSLANSILKDQLNGDTTKGAQDIFLKGMGISRAKVWIPFLKNISDSFNVAVNRAEVVFNVDPVFVGGTGRYFVPPKMALLPIAANGREVLTFDQYNTTDLNRYNGVYDSLDHRYVFNIARHVQAILKGEVNNYGFHLVVADPASPFAISSTDYTERRDTYIERVVLAGSNDPLRKPKCNISYIKFKHD